MFWWSNNEIPKFNKIIDIGLKLRHDSYIGYTDLDNMTIIDNLSYNKDTQLLIMKNYK